MSRSLVRALPLIALTIVLLTPSRAEARRPGLVLITHGESVKHVAEVPADKQAVLRELTHVDTDVGYLYSSFGVFWLDIWTWDGKYCLYEGDNVWVLEPSQAADVLDVSEGDLSKPLMYTFPPG